MGGRSGVIWRQVYANQFGCHFDSLVENLFYDPESRSPTQLA
jgi:hypothetical protein